MDSDTSHFIAVPLSYRKMSDEFGEGNNMIRERFFNIHELHRTLSNIDPQIIRERKRKYTVVDQVLCLKKFQLLDTYSPNFRKF
jgi:hypothetical protein